MVEVDNKILNSAVDIALQILEDAGVDSDVETKINIAEEIYFKILTQGGNRELSKNIIDSISVKISS